MKKFHSTFYKIHYNGYQINFKACFCGKNGFKSILNPILLSERKMGIDYIDNNLHHEIPL